MWGLRDRADKKTIHHRVAAAFDGVGGRRFECCGYGGKVAGGNGAEYGERGGRIGGCGGIGGGGGAEYGERGNACIGGCGREQCGGGKDWRVYIEHGVGGVADKCSLFKPDDAGADGWRLGRVGYGDI